MADAPPSMAQLLRFRAALDRLIQDLMGGPNGALRRPACAVDVVVDDEFVELSMEVPGVSPASLRVVARGDVLAVSGERAPAPGDFVCAERAVGHVEREITLPACDSRRAVATLRDGVLTVRLPRVEDRRGAEHTIPVRLHPGPPSPSVPSPGAP